MKYLSLLLGLIILMSWGCGQLSYSEEELQGEWQAVRLLQGGDTMDYDLSKVKLKFHSDLSYTYQSNLAEQEAGQYYLLGKILYTKDTTVNNPVEKAVQIEHLTNDSIRLLMRSSEGLQRLEMVRKQ